MEITLHSADFTTYLNWAVWVFFMCLTRAAAINRFYRLTWMCSLCQFVWMKIGVFSLKSAEAPLWAPVVLNGLSPPPPPPPPPPCAFALCWTDRHQSTMRAIKEQTDPYAFISLSRYFDVTQWSFCAALLQVKHTSGFFLYRELWDSCLRQILCCLWLWQNSGRQSVQASLNSVH